MATSRDYEPISGNPRRRTRSQSKETKARSTKQKTQSAGRKARVSVTPSDRAKLEAISEELGLPKAKVYNMAFQALLEKLGRK